MLTFGIAAITTARLPSFYHHKAFLKLKWQRWVPSSFQCHSLPIAVPQPQQACDRTGLSGMPPSTAPNLQSSKTEISGVCVGGGQFWRVLSPPVILFPVWITNDIIEAWNPNRILVEGCPASSRTSRAAKNTWDSFWHYGRLMGEFSVYWMEDCLPLDSE